MNYLDMKKSLFKSLFLRSATVLLGAAVLLLLVFQIPPAAAGGDSSSATMTTNSTAQSAEKTGKGGSQLWSENCARCHNMRSPSAYSDAEWEVVMHHMRVRARLTAEEHKAILEFLKSAN